MATRKVAIVITIEGANKAKNDIDALAASERRLRDQTKFLNAEQRKQETHLANMALKAQKLTHVQNGLTNSFIKGNLAARGISMGISFLQNALMAGIRSSMEFELTMVKTANVAGIQGESLRNLQNTVQRLGTEYLGTTNEIANTALEMAKLGLSGKDVEAALEPVIKLSSALNENVQGVGETIINVKNVYGLAAEDLNKVSGQLFKGFAASALDMEKFRVAFSYVGGTAKNVGVEFEDLVAMMGVLSNAGVRTSTIGTQLRRLLLGLGDASSKAGKEIGGQSIKTVGLYEALERLRDSGADAQKVFGIQAASVVPILLQQIDAIKQLRSELDGGEKELNAAGDAMKNTLTASVEQLTDSFKDMFIELEKVFGPIIGKLIKSFGQEFKDVANAIRTVRDAINGISWKDLQLLQIGMNQPKPEVASDFIAAEYGKIIDSVRKSNEAAKAASGETRQALEDELENYKNMFERFQVVPGAKFDFGNIKNEVIKMAQELDKLNMQDAALPFYQFAKQLESGFKDGTKAVKELKSEIDKLIQDKKLMDMGFMPKFETTNELINQAEKLLEKYRRIGDAENFEKTYDWLKKIKTEMIDTNYNLDDMKLKWELNNIGLETLDVTTEQFISDLKAMAIELNNLGYSAEAIAAMKFAIEIETNIKEANDELRLLKQYIEDVQDGLTTNIGTDELIKKLKELAVELQKTGDWKSLREVNRAIKELETNIVDVNHTLSITQQKMIDIGGATAGAIQQSISGFAQLAQQLGGNSDAFKALAMIEATAQTYVNAVMAYGSVFKNPLIPYPANQILAVTAAAGAIAAGLAQVAQISALAKGYNGMVREPTTFMAGESGPERVRVTPSSRVNSVRNDEYSNGLTVHIHGDVYGKEKFMRGVNEALQSINRRYVNA